MITVFSSSNRKDNRTRLVANKVYDFLKEHSKEEVLFFSLEDLPNDFIHQDMYSSDGQSEALAAIQDQYLIPATKLYFVVPEYNGGIPGILKLFIDACSVREYAASFHGNKKAALIGVSAGRSGGLRGLEYMTGFLHYLKINVLPNKLPISSIETLLTDNQLTNQGTLKALEQQVQEFLAF